MAALRREWLDLGKPFDESFHRQATLAGSELARFDPAVAVNADLHSAQVLRGSREHWLTVDPVLLRGDIAYDLARVLWTRIDEMPDQASIMDHFDAAAQAAGIDADQGRNSVLARTTLVTDVIGP